MPPREPDYPPVPERDLRRAFDRMVRDSLAPVAGGLSALYLIFTVSHSILLPPGPRPIMVSLAGGSALVLFAFQALLRQWTPPHRWAHPLGAGLAAVVLANSLVHLHLMAEPRQTTNLLLLIVGCGFLLLDSRWFLAVVTVTLGGWALVARAGQPSEEWPHFGFALLSATALTGLVHVVHVRQLRRLESLHLRDLERRGELERAVAAAETASQAKSDFLASMSHELRTPLNSIIGFTHVLLKNRSGGLDARELTFLERISSNGRHLLGLIDQVLDLSKIEAGRLELALESVDVGRLIEGTVEELQPLASAKGLGLEAELPAATRPLETDPARLKQVLINLVGNGVKFTESGAVVVRLRAAPDGRPLAIDVVDTGIGIAPTRLGTIFEAFEQGESGTRRRFQGTGLGLAISRFLCDRLDYRLAVETEPGRGSTFSILFDAASRSTVAAGRVAEGGA